MFITFVILLILIQICIYLNIKVCLYFSYRYTNFLMCYICAPNQNLFYGQEKLTVCEEFCNAWYSACSSAILKGSVIGDLYTNGREFCEKRNFMCEPMANKNCFIQLSDYALNHGSGASRVSSLPAVLGSMLFIYKVVMKTL
jgi:hypothetical protein